MKAGQLKLFKDGRIVRITQSTPSRQRAEVKLWWGRKGFFWVNYSELHELTLLNFMKLL